ncbi:MAG: GGDEF domain-containing protein, partial [Desulfobulbaceae bacterium]
MKPPEFRKSSWWWLSLLCFGLLLSLIYFEMGYFYPQVKRYFDNSGGPTAQPLVSRARVYLLKSLELYAEMAESEESSLKVRHNLNTAYGLINVDLYLQNYPCTAPTLELIDNLEQKLKQQQQGDVASYSLALLPILQCTDIIQAGQDDKRSQLAISLARNLDFHQKLLFWGSLVMVSTGLAFWALHMKQRRQIEAGRDETKHWRQHAMRDGLTGILNRRAFDADLKKSLDLYREKGRPFSLLMCDIDFFKQYNDSLGHLEGDKALLLVTDALTKALRAMDSLYRYGGEELVIILDNANISQARGIGLRALEVVRELRLPHPQSETGFLTISIGCATSSETDISAESLIALVDSRLYLA